MRLPVKNPTFTQVTDKCHRITKCRLGYSLITDT